MIEIGNWINKSEFENNLRTSGSKIVLFAADWCGYCRRFISIFQGFQPADKKKYEIMLVNADSEDGSLWDTYHIDLVPTLVVFKEGKETFRRNGRPSIGLQQKDLEDVLRFA